MLDTVIEKLQKSVYIPPFSFKNGEYTSQVGIFDAPAVNLSMGMVIQSREPIGGDLVNLARSSPDVITIFHKDPRSRGWNFRKLLPKDYPNFAERYSLDSQNLSVLQSYLSTFNLLDLKRMSHPVEYGKHSGKKNGSQLFKGQVLKGKMEWFLRSNGPVPYVLIDSGSIGGVGLNWNGLLFVAEDVADTSWKQKLVAYHETMCEGPHTHNFALQREREFANHLGVPRSDYLSWRRQIDHFRGYQ